MMLLQYIMLVLYDDVASINKHTKIVFIRRDEDVNVMHYVICVEYNVANKHARTTSHIRI